MRAKKLAVLAISSVVMSLSAAQFASAESTYFTYTYDFWNTAQDSPDAYGVNATYYGGDFGLKNFNAPQSLFARDNYLYVCDTDNNKIEILEYKDNKLSYVKTVDSYTDMSGAEASFGKIYDVFVDANETMYVADNTNHQILILDKDLKCTQVIKDPKDDSIAEDFEFSVTKLVVDDTGRVYCLAQGVNKGLMCFDPKADLEAYPNGKFTGFIGANRVTYTLWQRFWKTFATEAQKERMVNFVPTEYNNIALTDDGFYMVTTDIFDQWDMQAGEVFPVRKLNAMGSDIMIRNGYTNPIGDLSLYWGSAAGYNGCSRIVDCVTMPNETYYLLDRVRGRIFAYDSQGNLLFAFGGPGNKEGYLKSPTAIEAIGEELFVLDSTNGTITCFGLTDYGRLVNQAIDSYQIGHYDESADYWEEVQTYNGNYALSYIGVGRALLRQKDYKGAMKNFKVAYDFDNYSKAFKLFRKEWIEKNVAWLFAIALVLMVTPLAFQRIRRFVEEVNEVE